MKFKRFVELMNQLLEKRPETGEFTVLHISPENIIHENFQPPEIGRYICEEKELADLFQSPEIGHCFYGDEKQVFVSEIKLHTQPNAVLVS